MVGQEGELVMVAHSRVESGEKSAQSIAGALAMLMLRGERMEERLCIGMGLPSSPLVGAAGAGGRQDVVESTVLSRYYHSTRQYLHGATTVLGSTTTVLPQS